MSSSSSPSSGNDPFAWLGLLQWSLKYSDGTTPSSEAISPMSDEDRMFLEKVMKEGIINENERMKTILYDVTQQIETWKNQSNTEITNDTNVDDDEAVDTVIDLLQELRDIVEQIDFARAFMSMQGLPFLLGCIEDSNNIIPHISIRILCCAIIATLCQHNPPVQKSFLELGAIQILYNVLVTTIPSNNDNVNTPTSKANKDCTDFMARIIQAMSAIVRSYDLAENVFCQLSQATDIFHIGLIGRSNNGVESSENTVSVNSSSPTMVQKRALFFLHALVTSDTTSIERIQQFQFYIVHVIDTLVQRTMDKDDADKVIDQELKEMALHMIQQILEQRINVNPILVRKDMIAASAVQRINYLRNHNTKDDNDHDYTIELESWERILSLLADAKPIHIAPINE